MRTRILSKKTNTNSITKIINQPDRLPLKKTHKHTQAHKFTPHNSEIFQDYVVVVFFLVLLLCTLNHQKTTERAATHRVSINKTPKMKHWNTYTKPKVLDWDTCGWDCVCEPLQHNITCSNCSTHKQHINML